MSDDRDLWVDDNSLGNKLIERDIPDSEFERFLPENPHPWLWDASVDGRGISTHRYLLDYLVSAIRAAVASAVTIAVSLVAVVLVAAAVYTCIIMTLE